jgi:hypothetical protein
VLSQTEQPLCETRSVVGKPDRQDHSGTPGALHNDDPQIGREGKRLKSHHSASHELPGRDGLPARGGGGHPADISRARKGASKGPRHRLSEEDPANCLALHRFETKVRPSCCRSSLGWHADDEFPEPASQQAEWPTFKIDVSDFKTRLPKQRGAGQDLAKRLKSMPRGVFRRAADDEDLSILTPKMRVTVLAGRNVRKLRPGAVRGVHETEVLLKIHHHGFLPEKGTIERVRVDFCMAMFEIAIGREFRLPRREEEPKELMHHKDAASILTEAVQVLISKLLEIKRQDYDFLTAVWDREVGSRPDVLSDWFGAGRALVPRRTVNSGATFDMYDLIPTLSGRASEDPNTLLQNSTAVWEWLLRQIERTAMRPKERPTRFGQARDLATRLRAAGRPCSSSGNSDASCSSEGNQSAGSRQVCTLLD